MHVAMDRTSDHGAGQTTTIEPRHEGATDAASIVRQVLGDERYGRYFSGTSTDPSGRPARLCDAEGGVIVRTRDSFTAAILEKHFGQALRDAATGAGFTLRIEAGRRSSDPTPTNASTHAPRQAERADRRSEPAPGAAPTRRGDRREPGRRAAPVREPSLEEFEVGSSNGLAYASVEHLVDSSVPAHRGPVFLHGPCGVGKTHLLRAAVARFRARHPGARVRCVSAEAFTTEYVTAVRTDSVPAFQRRYRKMDLLAIDDVHFLATKSGTQDELLHTFDALDLAGARVLLASDEHPSLITKLSAALVSRFVSGAVVRIDTPEAALCERLVVRIAARRGLVLEPGAAEAAVRAARARFGSPSGRDLEGVVTQIAAYAGLLSKQAGGLFKLSVCERVVADAMAACGGMATAPSSTKPLRLVDIGTAVCEALGVAWQEVLGARRQAKLVLAREMTVHLAREMNGMSYPEIAAAMKRKSHAGVHDQHKRFAARCDRGERCPGESLSGRREAPGVPLTEMVEQVRTALDRGRRAAN